MVFILCGRWGDFLQVLFTQHTSASAFHLFKVVFTAYITHENQALDWLYIGACGNHIHRDGNTRVIIIAEGTQHRFRVVSGIGDFAAEVIAFAKLLTDNLNDVIRMAVRLCKNQCLWHFFSAWEQCGEQIILKGTDDRAYLTWVDNVPVKLGWLIIHILVQLFPSFGSGQTVTVFNQLFHQMSAVFAHLCFNEKDILANVNAVNDSLFSWVLADNILVEKRKSTVIRGGGQANDKGIKIGQHLAPHIINGAVAFIHDNAVKELRRIFLVVHHLFGSLALCRNKLRKGFFLDRFVQFFALQDGVHSLNGADANLDIVWYVGTFQPADTVKL